MTDIYKPIKHCPICSKTTGSRSVLCNNCGYKYNKEQKTLIDVYPEMVKELNDPMDGYKYSIGSHTKLIWRCKLGHIYKRTISKKIKNQNCPYCSNKKVLSGYNDLATVYPEILSEWDYKTNKLKPSEITYKSYKKVYWICKHKHTYKMSPNDKIVRHRGCVYCSGQKVFIGYNDLWTTHPELCKELVNKDDGYTHSKGSNKKIKWYCTKCNHTWKATPAHRTSDRGCPKCNKSAGEGKIIKVLKKYNIKHDVQKTFRGCKNKRLLRFDFYLSDYNICLEFHGIQHYPKEYKKSSRFTTSWKINDTYLQLTQKRDQIKRKFCKKNNIKLLEIPYWEFDNIEDILIKELNL